MGMVDVSEKPIVGREAVAEGRILLSSQTIEEIKGGRIKKGNPLQAAEIAGMNAAKQTHLLIPHCHQIPLNKVEVGFEVSSDCIDAVCHVKAKARTGVEMEALVGVTMALNTLWDMVKYLEKDTHGQYPSTRITEIRVLKKLKEG
ncbi:MAG: cyclic pyranopterin monophosphate synthase MoaC [Deltaproteobacteria bacterium]|nr:cyclic pyranopterin monophosphate synthase MoaC [Deltaproteobacteria bacterium]MBW1918651.1 cyclic pyranopterin monophosphate synthase MoaC [Deltaproteobacteria bacterium]MBW1933975.1 cyclic pyranopterin monophosphate synthase MoaC [Deltaproteobacteria bacterium]MBW1976606.1 cyclic pyranopterin monophosphate synthase MoaC [Deltaproteobacteria bacterium]MBW2043278.1 cyclic pyranopterin monophosphate synthase MoaC [Deltaproteobacteria bacterium]